MSLCRVAQSVAPALLALLASACTSSAGGGGGSRIVAAHDSAIIEHAIVSPYEAGTTKIRVILPRSLQKGRTYPVIYVLPVEAYDGTDHADGLAEVQKNGLADKYRVIFAAPTFSYVPWYADNPSDPKMRQETYLLRVVLPFVEGRYPAQHDRKGRFLLGFSKSGWGAFTLLLRHPQTFERALAYGSPLMMADAHRGYMRFVFGTQQNFERHQVTRLLAARASEFHAKSRLVVFNYHGYPGEMWEAHRFMRALDIAHDYQEGPAREHRWDSGWMPRAVAMLLARR